MPFHWTLVDEVQDWSRCLSRGAGWHSCTGWWWMPICFGVWSAVVLDLHCTFVTGAVWSQSHSFLMRLLCSSPKFFLTSRPRSCRVWKASEVSSSTVVTALKFDTYMTAVVMSNLPKVTFHCRSNAHSVRDWHLEISSTLQDLMERVIQHLVVLK